MFKKMFSVNFGKVSGCPVILGLWKRGSTVLLKGTATVNARFMTESVFRCKGRGSDWD